MKFETYLIYFIFFFVQAQESWNSFYVAFQGSNWDDKGWIVQNIYGNKFSQCGDEKLFGGYGSFGSLTLVSKYFTLPAHYQIKVSLTFYKIDSWDNEYFQLTVDNEIYIRTFSPWEGGNICGNRYSDLAVPIQYTKPHHTQSLVVMMIVYLDEGPYNESWGFKNFEIQLLLCPEGCQYCKDSTSDCYFWSNFAQFWLTSFNSEGWSTNNNQALISSICSGLEILGGTYVLLQGYTIQISLDNLPLHYEVQIVFKLWVIGAWENELFTLLIDDQVASTFSIVTGGQLNFNCGFYQQVKIINSDIAVSHTSAQIKIAMNAQQIFEKYAYWGVQSFDLFKAKCPQGCEECYGYQKNQCIKCMKKWVFLDGCIPVPPIECAQVRIAQLYNCQANFKNSFEIYIDELATNYKEIGQTKLFLNQSHSAISIQIIVRCQEKLNIASYFRNCQKCQQDLYQFTHQCSEKSNTLIYNANFLEPVKYDKELLITIQESQLQMDQLLIINEIEEYVIIFKINI